MPKKLREYPIYVAPGIKGELKDDGPYVFDEETDTVLDPNILSDKITIYERQVKGWFLDRATSISKVRNNGFIVLMICLSYLEGVEQYRVGQRSNNQSRQFFVNALERLYPNQYAKDKLEDLYRQARCGLFHNGMTESKIIYDYDVTVPIDFSDEFAIVVNPKILLQDIQNDFRYYIQNLRNDSILQANFDRMFTIL